MNALAFADRYITIDPVCMTAAAIVLGMAIPTLIYCLTRVGAALATTATPAPDNSPAPRTPPARPLTVICESVAITSQHESVSPPASIRCLCCDPLAVAPSARW
jgi:hypothetical protein